MHESEPARPALGEFLRSRRERLRPEAVGLVAGRRRTPGLRREEVAQRAGVSCDWYLRLEQGRDVTPSVSVLEAIAGALALGPAERAHLFRLARRQEPPLRGSSDEVVQPALERVMRCLGGTPSLLLGRRLDILAWNAAATRLFGDCARIPAHRRNFLRMSLLVPEVRSLYVERERVVSDSVAALRASYARHPGDARFAELVSLLSRRSGTFRRAWARGDVAEVSGGRWLLRRHGRELAVHFDALLAPGDLDQRLLVFSPG